MGKNYGPSRVRWLLIGLTIGLVIGIILGNPNTGLTSITSPGDLISALTSITL